MRNTTPDRQRRLLTALLSRITLHADTIRMEVNRSALARLLESEEELSELSDEPFEVSIPVTLRRRGVEARLVMLAPNQSHEPDPKLIALLADAVRWIDDLAQGRAVSVRDLARCYGRDPGEVSRTLPLAFLAPEIIASMLDGRQPVHLRPQHLLRVRYLHHDWDEQRRRLGFDIGGRRE